MLRLFALLFCLVATPALALVPVQKVKSRGGLTAWLVADHSLPLITLKMAWRGGALTDLKKPGLTALMAALMNEGAGDLPATQFQKNLDEKAIKLSFTATADEIVGTLRCLSAHRQTCFDLLRLAVTVPRFDPKTLHRRRAAQLAALQRRGQSAGLLARDNFYELAFGTHPYGRPVGGTPQGLADITQQDLTAHHRAHIARDNLLLAVVGDIFPRDLKQALDAIFGDLPPRAKTKTAPPRLPTHGPFHKHQYRAGPQTTVLMGHGGVGYNDPDFFAAFTMNHILGGGGFTSRLTHEVREKRGLAYSVSSHLLPRAHANLWLAQVATDNRKAAEALAVIRQEMARMREAKPAPDTLAPAKQFLTGAYALRFDSGAKIADQLLGVQLNGWPISYFATRNKRVRAVTAQEVQDAARRLLRPDDLLVSSVGGNDLGPVIYDNVIGK